MVSFQGKLSACLQLIRSDPNYQNILSHHNPCQSCLFCSRNPYFPSETNEKYQNPISILSEIIKSSEDSSPEKSIFSLSLTKKTKCECLTLVGQRDLHFEEYYCQGLIEPFNLSSALHNQVNINRIGYCPDTECQIRKSKSSGHIKNTKGLYFLSLNWRERNLETLLHIIKGIPSLLYLDSIYKAPTNTKKYLQGMIVEGWNQCLYIQLYPCFLFNSNSSEEIFLDYLPFIILQYSLFPTLLVYGDKENLGWDTILSKWGEELFLYKNFLTGDNKFLNICFYCWNQSHDNCENLNLSEEWDCHQCALKNPSYVIFCLQCDIFRRPIIDSDLSLCKVCIKPNCGFLYCKPCSQQGFCKYCSRAVYKTQAFLCPHCYVWVNSTYCKTCCTTIDPLKIICYRCATNFINSEEICSHNIGKSRCQVCLYEYTCAICCKNKTINDGAFCWKTKTRLRDCFCDKCEKYIPGNSLVCYNCVFSLKICKEGHLITKQSVKECPSCLRESSKFCLKCSDFDKEKCADRMFCNECSKELNDFSITKCRVCNMNPANNTENLGSCCKKYQVCEDCYGVLNTCPCGAKTITLDETCPKCKCDIKTKPLIIAKIYCKDNRGWTCKSCNFSNRIANDYCENCNMSTNENIKLKCTICNKECYGKICDFCNKIGNCGWCRKNILPSQGRYCAKCAGLCTERICENCLGIGVSKQDTICFMCSKSLWVCSCGKKYPPWHKKCDNCNRAKHLICAICDINYEQKKDCWRCGGICKNVPKNYCLGKKVSVVKDVNLCGGCSLKQKFCLCGSRILEVENVCKTCNREIKD
ncbi:hypothetical protein SteCoe_14432 [Stentor coeruleus]|uniref:RanBP2-type domain-containing protein n=1 Tax=Stentor coeruleus TaxID=5963 RepID=A0A1R2C611_9CILI|nr:hypothetical protein SteCoe_25690 [Stentor coeruleus]OMJ84427.1 hypothetical protein SteCoe_14432 [Stentor coeruleus]